MHPTLCPPLCDTAAQHSCQSKPHQLCGETTVESAEHEISWRKRDDHCEGIKVRWGRIGAVSPVCHFSVDYSLRSGAWAEWWSLIILCALLMSGSRRSSSLWKPTGARQRARGAGWGVTLCAYSEFWFVLFFYSGVSVLLQLNYAESRLTQLEGCHCERTCSANGLVYRDKELWVEPENCRNCACKVSVTFVFKNHRMMDFSIMIWKKKVCQIECFNPFLSREVSLPTSKWKNPPLQGDYSSLFSTISFMLRKMFVNIERENNWGVRHFKKAVCETVDSTPQIAN